MINADNDEGRQLAAGDEVCRRLGRLPVVAGQAVAVAKQVLAVTAGTAPGRGGRAMRPCGCSLQAAPTCEETHVDTY